MPANIVAPEDHMPSEIAMEIKSVTDAVLFTSSLLTLKNALVEAVNKGADLRGADLYGADLYGADLYGANLRGADKVELHIARLQFIPETGSFEAWKKCKDGVIVKLLIPDEAKRSHSTGRKCRASKAVVLDIIGGADEAVSLHDKNFIYRKGETVVSASWGEDRWEECAPGIHFYITRLEAENHN